MLLCRVFDSDDDSGNVIKLQCFPVPTDDVVVEMQTSLGTSSTRSYRTINASGCRMVYRIGVRVNHRLGV